MDMAANMRSHGEGSEGMDARLWGELQHHIDLAMVYAKLSIWDFFRLRLVCKEWNRLASDLEFLEETFRDPIPKPYFLVNTWKMKNRLLTYDGSSRRWNRTRTPYAICEVEGVFREDFYTHRIFNVHKRVFYDPPRPPQYEEDRNEDLGDDPLGMTVDTSVRPYSFQMILGNEFTETQRTYNDSTLIVANCQTHWTSSCAQCKGFLCIRGHGVDLHSYNLEREEWSINSPANPDEDMWLFCDIGAWRGHLFFLGMK